MAPFAGLRWGQTKDPVRHDVVGLLTVLNSQALVYLITDAGLQPHFWRDLGHAVKPHLRRDTLRLHDKGDSNHPMLDHAF